MDYNAIWFSSSIFKEEKIIKLHKMSFFLFRPVVESVVFFFLIKYLRPAYIFLNYNNDFFSMGSYKGQYGTDNGLFRQLQTAKKTANCSRTALKSCLFLSSMIFMTNGWRKDYGMPFRKRQL